MTVTAPAAGLFALAGGTVLKSYGWSDTLTAINAVTGSTGADSFTGAITSHSFLPIAFRGGPGNDTINGQSSEINQVDYATASAAVTVDLAAGTALAGADGTDTLVNVRSVGASDHNDTILGSAANDTLRVGQLGLHLLDG